MAVATRYGRLLVQMRIPICAPAETLRASILWFTAQPPVAAFGIGSFGLTTFPTSAGLNRTMQTPKPAGVGQRRRAFRGFGVPVALVTDVNAAALGEHRWGAAQGLEAAIDLTVRTGISSDRAVDGRSAHGLL